MLEIISHIPFFVWPLFLLLLLAGLKASKPHSVPLKAILIPPTLFFVWSVYSFFGKYSENTLSIFLWAIILGCGFVIGYSYMQKASLQFDKQNGKIHMPGSWMPLTLSMSIFTLRFSIGMLSGMFPDLIGSASLLSLELCATIILGIFLGRGIGCLLRYQEDKIGDNL